MSEEKHAVFVDGHISAAGTIDDATVSKVNAELDRLRNESSRLASQYADALSFYKLLLGTIVDRQVH